MYVCVRVRACVCVCVCLSVRQCVKTLPHLYVVSGEHRCDPTVRAPLLSAATRVAGSAPLREGPGCELAS